LDIKLDIAEKDSIRSHEEVSVANPNSHELIQHRPEGNRNIPVRVNN
jgi:hypothetical protein